MLARITSVWGIHIGKAALETTIGSALLTSSASFIERELVGNVLKLIPGIGRIAGAALNAGVAGTVTTAVGTAWTAVIQQLADTPDRVAGMSATDIRKAFESELRKSKNKPDYRDIDGRPGWPLPSDDSRRGRRTRKGRTRVGPTSARNG